MSTTKPWETVFVPRVAEKTTCVIGPKADGTGSVLTDELGVAVPLADLGTVKCWLYVAPETGVVPTAFINNRSAQDVKNVNGGVITAGGVFSLTLAPADNPMVDASLTEETHEVYVEFTYNGGAKTGRQIWRFAVANLPVPT